MKSLRKLLVFIFRFTVFAVMFAIFVYGFSSHYIGLRFFSRTLAIITAAFAFFTLWMSTVYGKVEIGEKKTKPLFHIIALNMLVSDSLTFLALRVMTIHENFPLLKDLLMLLMVFIAQLIVARLLIAIANSAYFINYVADKTLIVSNNSKHLDKVLFYFDKHKKQYELLDVLNIDSAYDISLMDVEKLFLLDVNDQLLKQILEKSFLLDMDIYFTPSLSQLILGKNDTFMVDDIIFYRYRTQKITMLEHSIKRVIDIMVSSVALILASPFMLLIAIAIKLDDRGPVVFSQERVTKNGRVFKIYKFRSMKMNSGDMPAKKDDDRITRVGRIIRAVRLDELPQLFNIIKGDMSVVGPRPESVAMMKKITKEVPAFSYRLKVKAGLTGTAQIQGKYNTDSADKLLMDLYYIENFSIFNDLKLMFQTLLVFVKKDSTEGHDPESESEIK